MRTFTCNGFAYNIYECNINKLTKPTRLRFTPLYAMQFSFSPVPI